MIGSSTKRLVYGVGYDSIGSYKKTIKRKHTKTYKTWCGMLERCYNKEYHDKNPTYKDCSVEESWHNFQIFAKWFEENYKEGFHLDKDILIKGNKIYSPETCCFIPQEINTLVIGCGGARGKLPIGVRNGGNRFEARINKNLISVYIGSFTTVEEAFQAYKTEKEAYIKEVAEKYKGQITEACYQALYKYQIEIND